MLNYKIKYAVIYFCLFYIDEVSFVHFFILSCLKNVPIFIRNMSLFWSF